MPKHDPIASRRNDTRRRFWRAFRVLALLSVVIAALGVVLVARGDPTIHVHMLIATAFGIGFTVLLGTGLMTLVFLSNSSGHDNDAAGNQHKGDQE